ncbi:MAG: hypothetical protein ACE5FQ_02880, partial [Thiogranum sp.]
TASMQAHATPTAGAARRALQTACEQNDPQAAVCALLDWAAGTWPDRPPRNLGALAHYVDSGADEIHALDRALYGTESSPWNGQALWERFRQGPGNGRQQETSAPADTLLPLYPRWG